MNAILVFCALSFLLVIGKLLRVRLPVLERLYLPASVIGGVVGLALASGWEEGIALGFTVATLGMIIGIVFGMVIVHWAFRRGYVRGVRTFEARTPSERHGIHRRESALK